uniref:beta strand repeat-containing protein n=1 Tax=Blastomonas sp. TaxID=1909299 RepID=UPI003593011C
MVSPSIVSQPFAQEQGRVRLRHSGKTLRGRMLASCSLTAAALALSLTMGRAEAQVRDNSDFYARNAPMLPVASAGPLPPAGMPVRSDMRVEHQPHDRGVIGAILIAENIPYRPTAMPADMMVASQLNADVSRPVFTPENQPHSRINLPDFAPQEQPHVVNPAFAVQATPAIPIGGGSAGISRTANVDTIRPSSGELIINWTPFDNPTTGGGAIDFLPVGKTLEFLGTTTFTVLNRILPSDTGRVARFDGTVRSRIGTQVGGNVWFFSPGGIIAGSSSVFDVGSLLLTTNNIDTTGGLFGTGNTLRLRGPSGSTSAVVIEAGASILQTQANSYFIAAAPRVEQRGRIDVNGSAVLLAAEQADIRFNTSSANFMTFNNGLFDITVLAGTDDANGIIHTGTTTGPTRTPTPDVGYGANPDNQVISMVAVPKNNAITMLVSGNIGYAPAVTAAQRDGVIILSAGRNTSGASFGEAASPVDGSIQFGNLNLSNDLFASATNDIEMVASGLSRAASVQVNAARNISLAADGEIDFGANQGGSITVAGNVSLRAGNGAQGGTISIFANADPSATSPLATVEIGGNLTASVDGFGRVETNVAGLGENGAGGTLTLDVLTGGAFQVSGLTTLSADGTGGARAAGLGASRGGLVNINLTGAASVISLNELNVSANALDASSGRNNALPGTGNDATGGSIRVSASDGRFDVLNARFEANADALTGSNPTMASGGVIDLVFRGGTHGMGSLQASSIANSDNGVARYGSISLLADNATLNVSNSVSLIARTSGDNLAPSGATISVEAINQARIDAGSFLEITTEAFESNSPSVVRGGNVSLAANNGAISADLLIVSTNVDLGFFNDANGSTALGGAASMLALNGGTIDFDFADVNASARGGSGSSGGQGLGGSVSINAQNGRIGNSGSEMFVSANGLGGARASASDENGFGQGGTINIAVQGTSGAIVLNSLSASADGAFAADSETGGTSNAASGGTAVGGLLTLDLAGGTFAVEDMFVGADGFGSDGGDGFDFGYGNASPVGDGGLGVGGQVIVNLNGAEVDVGRFTASAGGFGGLGGSNDAPNGQRSGNGGVGEGGRVTFNAVSGQMTVGELTLAANGNDNFFGRGGTSRINGSGDGGAGAGGSALFLNDGTATISADTIRVQARGIGGEGGFAEDGRAAGAGGASEGGEAQYIDRAGSISFNLLEVDADGIGGIGGESFDFGYGAGAGGRGGSGSGGLARIILAQDDETASVYTVRAQGRGGNGGNGGIGASGGFGIGGTAELTVRDSVIDLGSTTIDARGFGGNGTAGPTAGSAGGAGGDAEGGVARLIGQGTAQVTLDTITFTADALGGNGANGAAGGALAGGSGGNAGGGTGGTLELLTFGESVLDVSAQNGIILSATGTGGIAGTGGNTAAIAPPVPSGAPT